MTSVHELPPSERIEREALEDLFDAATPELARTLNLSATRTGEALVAVAGTLPSSAIVVNRALGFGLGTPAQPSDVEAVIAAYGDAGVERFFFQISAQAMPPQLTSWVLNAGLERARAWQKFARDVSPTPEVRTSLACRRVDSAHGEAFARIVCDAFDLGDAARPWLALLPGRERWHVFMSFEGDRPAGTGALFVEDGFGWLDFGATTPALRRRGSQSALMAARIAYAATLGCHTLFTCTGEDVPGDPQHSYRNIKRAGFIESTLRENYAPPRR